MLTTSIFTSVTFQGYPFLKLSVGQNKDLHTGYGCHIIPHCVNSIDLAKSLRAPARSLGRPCRPKPFQGLRTSEGFAKCKTLRKASRALPAMLDEQTTMTDLVYRHLISDLKLIDTLITQFELVHTDNDKWTKTYLDKAKNDNWLSYYVDGAQHGGGQKILGRLPLPSTEKLIDIAIHSESEDEVFAACRTMT